MWPMEDYFLDHKKFSFLIRYLVIFNDGQDEWSLLQSEKVFTV